MQSSWVMRTLGVVERVGNHLPHPFWLFCALLLAVSVGSSTLEWSGVVVERPETQLLQSDGPSGPVPGRTVVVDADFEPLQIDLTASSHSSRLGNLYLEVRDGSDRLLFEEGLQRSELVSLHVGPDTAPVLADPGEYRIHVVNRGSEAPVRGLLSAAGLKWFVLEMVTNFSHFEPLGLVLVMLMGVAVAEGAGLIPTAMRAIALLVPARFVTPVMFALGACGNIGSDAGIVVIPPLAAAIYRQLGRSPIAGLLVGYVGATAGFTANMLPAGTDVLAMSLTNAATGGNPEVNVLCNWYFMTASVVFLAVVGTFVTNRYVAPRLEAPAASSTPAELPALTRTERRALGIAAGAVVIAAALWSLTILPEGAPLRHPDPNPDLIWRSPFFKGLVPILFTLFVVGGVAYGKAAGTIKKADDVIEYMTDSMKRMGGYIVLVLVISQFTRAFQFARLDEWIAVNGASLLRAMGMESLPIPFFIAFVIIIAVANLFMGSASAKWAIFAPIFVPMFMSLGFHPAFTQLLYRLGDSITNCVSPLYPFFPILLGWIAAEDKSKAKVGTVLSYLVPYAAFLLVSWLSMMVIWYMLGLPVGPDSPLRL